MDRIRLLTTRMGLALIAVGAYLPWITTNPQWDVELLAHPAGLSSGLEIWGLVTFPLAIIALVGTIVENRLLSSRSFRLVAGLLSVGFGATFVVGGPGVTGRYIVGSGVTLTIIGGVLVIGTQLMISSWSRLGWKHRSDTH